MMVRVFGLDAAEKIVTEWAGSLLAVTSSGSLGWRRASRTDSACATFWIKRPSGSAQTCVRGRQTTSL